MTAIERGRQGQTTGEWRVDLVGGLKGFFIGGNSTASISIRPVAGMQNAAEYERLEKLCDATKKGAVCNIVGPAAVTLGTNRGQAKVEAALDERAELEVRNTVVFCRDPRAMRPS